MESRLPDYFSKSELEYQLSLERAIYQEPARKEDSDRCSGGDDCPSWRTLRSHGWFSSQNFVLAGMS
jgi:hypothetical protein